MVNNMGDRIVQEMIVTATYRGQVYLATGKLNPLWVVVNPPIECTHQHEEHSEIISYSYDDIEFLIKKLVSLSVLYVTGKNLLAVLDGIWDCPIAYNVDDCRPELTSIDAIEGKWILLRFPSEGNPQWKLF